MGRSPTGPPSVDAGRAARPPRRRTTGKPVSRVPRRARRPSASWTSRTGAPRGSRSAAARTATWRSPAMARCHGCTPSSRGSVGSHWLIVDDGLSSNGTFVSAERVIGRRRLYDGDVVRLGETTAMLFRDPCRGAAADDPAVGDEGHVAANVTEAQRRVLVALCRPYKHHPTDAIPATNPQIAAELHLTVAAVKTHLRALFHAFELGELPPAGEAPEAGGPRVRLRSRDRPRSVAIRRRARSARALCGSPQIEQPPLNTRPSVE